jgi:ankyrin repeat protein
MPHTPIDQFTHAVRNRDANALAGLFREYPDLKTHIDDPLFSFDAPAIVQAAWHGDRPMVDVLLEHGADINARTSWWAGGFTVIGDDPEFAEFLISRGAIVDVHAAARLGRLDRLKELVAADPSVVRARGGDGQLPLHVARTVEVAGFLLAHGAPIDARDIDHESTAAQYMMDARHDVARFLVERGAATDLLMVSALGDLARVRRTLDADPASIRIAVDSEWFPMQNPHAGGSIYIWTLGKHRTAFQVAKKFGHHEVAALLFDRSPADWKLVNACLAGDDETAKALLSANPGLAASLSDRDLRRLEEAAEDNDTRAVQLMLECGWPVAGVRHTPLHWAAWHGNAAMVRAILAHDPPLERRDPDHGATPLGWALHGSEHGWHAKTGDYSGAIRALREAGAEEPGTTGTTGTTGT